VFKNLRRESWKDVLVDLDPVRDFLGELEVCRRDFDVLTCEVMLWGCDFMVL